MDTEPDPPIEAEARPAPTPTASGPVPNAATTGSAPGESAVKKDGRRSGRRLATVAGIVALIASAVFGLVQLGTFTASAPVLIDGTPDSWTASLALLRDLGRWDAASADERRQAAEAVDERMDAFRLDRIETFAAGGQRHEIAIFDHAKTAMEFVLVPVGTFQMGSPENEKDRGNDEAQHQVTLTNPLLIARTECTQAAWDRVGGDDERGWRGASLPIDSVSWEDVTAWCAKAGLRLPTEAEWEYACRAGTTTPFNVGEDITTDQANYDGNSPYRGTKGAYRAKTVAVATLAQNAFGLFDMHGNVWEWCQDVYDSTYPTAPVTDPVSTSGSGYRVYRGGSWVSKAQRVRSALRYGGTPGSGNSDLGFRPAQSVTAD